MRERLTLLTRAVTDAIKPSIYRIAPYVVLSLFDDPAMLALAFC